MQMAGGLDIDFLKSSPSYASWAKVAGAVKASAANVAPGVFTAHEAMQVRVLLAAFLHAIGHTVMARACARVWAARPRGGTHP